MKFFYTLLIVLFPILLFAQVKEEVLPLGYSQSELKLIENGTYTFTGNEKGITTPPPFPVRSMAEWEELQALVITWTSFPEVLTEIVRYAQEEVEVVIIARPSQVASIQFTLSIQNEIPMDNVTILTDNYNSVWMRDYGANPIYANDVDSLYFADWIYNRNRPRDDTIPETIANYFETEVYETAEAPMDLVNTGGNFMSDGLGRAFSSKLVLDENGPNNFWGISNHDEEDVDQIMFDFMGINEYIKMDVLPYDGINHIDMHMKILDEQTLLVGTFPEGVSDGPQLEANIAYVTDNFQTSFDTPFRVERIVQPPCANGLYPPQCSFGAEYRTYTNAMFVNKTILVPIYNTDLDDEALARWAEVMPGYKIRGIDCTDIINSGGAIHCITKEVGVDDPLWIAHAELPDLMPDQNTDDYEVDAIVKHRSGIANATLFWTTDTLAGYTSVEMSLINAAEDMWSATIPNQEEGSELFYYIHAEANSGKTMVRPIVAPEGYLRFQIGELVSTQESGLEKAAVFQDIYPNPASALTVIPVKLAKAMQGKIVVKDILGREVKEIFAGTIPAGETNYYFNAADFVDGNYFVELSGEKVQEVQKVVIR